MHCICIIPVNTEVLRSRFQRSKASDNLIRIADTFRIRIFRYTPDTLYAAVVFYIFFYQIHIRSILMHRDIDHFNAKLLCDRKMSVISRNRAEELHMLLLAPWFAATYTKCIRTCNCIIHNRKTRITTHDHILALCIYHTCHKSFCFRNTVQYTIVAAVCSILGNKLRRRIQNIHNPHGKSQLFRRRFSSCHVQAQSFTLRICVLFIQSTL